MDKESKEQMIYVQAESALNELVRLYIDEFFPRPLSRREDKTDTDNMRQAKTIRDHNIIYLVSCSSISELDRNSVNTALFMITEAMKKFEHDATGFIHNRKQVRRKVEEIRSILRIASAYPDNALKRLKKVTQVKFDRTKS